LHGFAAGEEVSDIKQATSALYKAKAPGGKLSGALCFARPNNRFRILFVCTVFMPATSIPKLYNPRHPERTLFHSSVLP
jgi:hypothetical protein